MFRKSSHIDRYFIIFCCSHVLMVALLSGFFLFDAFSLSTSHSEDSRLTEQVNQPELKTKSVIWTSDKFISFYDEMPTVGRVEFILSNPAARNSYSTIVTVSSIPDPPLGANIYESSLLRDFGVTASVVGDFSSQLVKEFVLNFTRYSTYPPNELSSRLLSFSLIALELFLLLSLQLSNHHGSPGPCKWAPFHFESLTTDALGVLSSTFIVRSVSYELRAKAMGI